MGFDVTEPRGDMAAFTALTELTSMNIVARMTTHASTACLYFSIYRRVVAVGTGQLRVRAVQLEIRLRIVVEGPKPPAVWIVTGLTVGPERLFVRIVLGVAVIALGGRILECRRHVTLLARRHGMQPYQREFRQTVIECNLCAPPAFIVALRALLALLPVVHVITRMAGITGGFELVGIEVALVTTLAADLGVTPAQRIFGVPVVVERDGLPTRFLVAAVALATEAALVPVVEFVAAVAVGPQLVFV